MSEFDIQKNEAGYMADLKSHRGWVIVMRKAAERIAYLRQKMSSTEDPVQVFACVRELQGLEFVLDIPNYVIRMGDDAIAQLRASE